jgi:hypothetical protein
MSDVLAVHIAQPDHSLAYYDINLKFLGGTTFPVPPGSQTFFCYSGQMADGAYQTTCNVVGEDNSFSPGPYCSVSIGQVVVRDGCYRADRSAAALRVAAGSHLPTLPTLPFSAGTSIKVELTIAVLAMFLFVVRDLVSLITL